jgi:hypothetical protein
MDFCSRVTSIEMKRDELVIYSLNGVSPILSEFFLSSLISSCFGNIAPRLDARASAYLFLSILECSLDEGILSRD